MASAITWTSSPGTRPLTWASMWTSTAYCTTFQLLAARHVLAPLVQMALRTFPETLEGHGPGAGYRFIVMEILVVVETGEDAAGGGLCFRSYSTRSTSRESCKSLSYRFAVNQRDIPLPARQMAAAYRAQPISQIMALPQPL